MRTEVYYNRSIYLFPPRIHDSIIGIPRLMKNLPPTLPGCGIRNLVKNCGMISRY